MAPASSKLDRIAILSAVVPKVPHLLLTGAGVAAWKLRPLKFLRDFFTGPGRTRRILVLLFTLLNLKNIPFAWMFRIYYTMFYHHFYGQAPPLGPRGLFAPVISPSRVTLLESDHYGHKSNSTYFADLDVSRTHLLSYACRDGLQAVARNASTRLVLDPATGQPIKGKLVVMLGGVQCSFHREIPPLARYEIWSRILTWDRKWVYILTHFVAPGAGRPSEWLDPRFRKLKTTDAPAKDWEKKIFATAVSKGVYKLGRFTVHPAIVLGASGLLPERPGGWKITDTDAAQNPMNGSATGLDMGDEDDGVWDWKRVEHRRRKGMEFAQHIAALDGLALMFDGGRGSAIGRFGPA